MLEMETRNLEAASKHLSQAIELHPNDSSIRDTEGKLALTLALAEADPTKASALFDKAEALFQRNIRGRLDEPYGYRHLAETYVERAEKLEQSDRQLRYIRMAYEVLLDGIRLCESTSMLFQYEGKLEEKFGNPENARKAFERAIKEKPGDIVTRMMAARLEERENNAEKALEILEQAFNVDPHHVELHYRVAMLLAVTHPERDAEIRKHFQASLLKSARNYRYKLAYAAYLFSQKDFQRAGEQFLELENLTFVPRMERYETWKFHFGILRDRHVGRIRRLGHNSGYVDFAQGATEIFFSPRQAAEDIIPALTVGKQINFEIRFNLRGAVAVAIQANANGK